MDCKQSTASSHNFTRFRLWLLPLLIYRLMFFSEIYFEMFFQKIFHFCHLISNLYIFIIFNFLPPHFQIFPSSFFIANINHNRYIFIKLIFLQFQNSLNSSLTITLSSHIRHKYYISCRIIHYPSYIILIKPLNKLFCTIQLY